jgi:hypothetical protein
MTTLGNANGTRTPTGMKVAPMSYAKLEEVADGVRVLLPTEKAYGGGPWKIDAWRVLEQTLERGGFHFHPVEANELEECAAFTVPERKLIVLREDVYEGLFVGDVFSRSTVVHELSHIVLNHAITLHRGATLGKHEFFEDSEWQAKALTAAIMMPIDACVVAHNPEELAYLCGTSVQAAGYRMNNLIKHGRLDPDRYKDSLFSAVNDEGEKP